MGDCGDFNFGPAPLGEGEGVDERLISVRCALGETACVIEAAMLVDQTQSFIKVEDC